MMTSATSRALLRLFIGHRSEMLDRPTPQGHTHRWTVFVRSAGQHPFVDRTFVTKVVFELHPDFANPHRVVKEPPFEVTETGYAGFSIPVSVSFSGTSKTYRLYYDMNLCLEKQSEHVVEQILEIKQPSKSFYELIMKYGGVVKKGKKKEKHRQRQKQMPTENTNEKEDEDSTVEEFNKKREKSRDQLEPTKNRKERESADSGESRMRRERERESVEEEDTTSRKEIEQQQQRERDADDKSDIEMRKSTDGKEENERRKGKESSRPIDNENCQATAISSVRNNKVTPRSNNDRMPSNSEREKVKRSKANSDETESVVVKKSRMDEDELESLKALQRKLMTICDVERLQAVVEAVIASGPTSGLQMARMCLSEDNFLSFDLCALSASLLSQFEEICSKQV